MAVEQTWPLTPTAAPPVSPPVSVSGVGVATVSAAERAYLGYCLLRPFQRDAKRDFANAGGVRLVIAAVVQVLGTIADSGVTQGELPWRTDFGSVVELLRHRNPDPIFDELAWVYVVEALQRWEPRAIAKSVKITKEYSDNDATVYLKVNFDIASSNTPGSEIIARDITASVSLS